jgi:hypothetical protein
MKRNILVLMAVVFSMQVMGQRDIKHVVIQEQVVAQDTLRTFSIVNIDLDAGRNNFIQHWGTPARNEAGRMEWRNVDLGPIGQGLTISLEDKICLRNGAGLSCSLFTSVPDKLEQIAHLQPNEFRMVDITIINAQGQNVVKDAVKAESAARILNRINL